MLARHAAYGPLEENTVIRCGQRVLFMPQVDLELARSIFGRYGSGGNALKITGLSDVLQQILEGVDLVHSIDLGAGFALSREGGERRLRQVASGTLFVEEIEFQLEGDDRPQAQFLDLPQAAGEHVAGFKGKRVALAVFEGQEQLPERALRPGYGFQGARDRARDVIWITVGKALAAGIVAASAGVEQEDRGGEADAGAPDCGKVLYRVALSPDDAGKVGKQEVDGKGVRMLLEERCNFRMQAGVLMRHSGPWPLLRAAASSSAHLKVATSLAGQHSTAGPCLVHLYVGHAAGGRDADHV